MVVVCGANEIGKSSMIEALDLLLESKDRSTKKEVKQVKPTNADVGSEVTAEISSGPYRFVYRKRFHKKCETELTVLAPRREQLTGDEAHDRVRAMLAETVDTELWHAQRVLQAASTAPVDLSGCDALSRALDVAAANPVTDAALSGTEPLLIERIDAEYARYFTATGRPTGEWAAAISRLAGAEAEVAGACGRGRRGRRAGASPRRTDRAGRRSCRSSGSPPVLGSPPRAPPRTRSQSSIGQAREAKLVAAAAAANSATAAAAHAGRLRLLTEIETRTAALAVTEAEAQEAADAQLAAGAEAAAADAAIEEATRVRTAAQQRGQAARRALDQLADREEADRLGARLAKIDAIQRDRDRVCERAVRGHHDRTAAAAHRKRRGRSRSHRRPAGLALDGGGIHGCRRHRTRHWRPTSGVVGGPELVDDRHRRHRGRGSRCPDCPRHPRRDRARHRC